jgi:hypothetical protein
MAVAGENLSRHRQKCPKRIALLARSLNLLRTQQSSEFEFWY